MSITPKLERKLRMDLRSTVSTKRIVGLYRLMRGFRGLYLGALVVVALGATMRTYYYRLVQHAVDAVFGDPAAVGQLPLVAGGFVGLAILEGLFAYLRGTWSARTAEGITLRLRNYLLDHLQRLPFSFHDYVRTGELIQRTTSDVDAVRRFYAEQALGIGRILALFAINFSVLLAMNTRLALTSIAIMPLIVGLSAFFFGRVSKAYEAYQQQEARLSTVLQESLSGVRVVRAFARQAYEIGKFEKENAEKYRRGRRLTMMHSLYWPISDTLCASQTLLAMAVGAGMAIRGEITLGTYIAAMGMVMWIIWPMRNLGRLIVRISTGLVSYQRVAEVLKEEREDVSSGTVPTETRLSGAVAFERVSFAYEPQDVLQSPQSASAGKGEANDVDAGDDGRAVAQAPVPVLHDITFACSPGESVALLGSTGSGKTSIINLLLRFYEHQAGTILMDGVPIEAYPRWLLRANIGIVEQEPFLFSRSIRDNIAYGAQLEVSDEEVRAAAKVAAIHDIIETFPDGYETVVGEKGVTLSGGQRQRVAIARAVLKDPRILVLDDATSSVDTETEEQIQGALATLMAGRTTFLVAHRIQTVMGADLILVLDRGKIVQSGTHQTLVSQEGLYREIYEIQSRIDEEVRREVAAEAAPVAG